MDFDNAVLIIVTVMLTEFGKDAYAKVKQRLKHMRSKTYVRKSKIV